MRRRLAILIAAIWATPVMAAGDTPPRLTNPGSWLAKREPPPGVLKRGERVLTWFAVGISPEGQPTGCKTEQSSGYPVLDDYACNLFKENGRFAPARDQAGKPVEGVSDRYLTWEASANATDAGSSKASAAKASPDAGRWVTTDDLPRGLMQPDEVVVSHFVLTVSAKGDVTNCDILLPSARPELDRRACQLIILRGKYKPARDQDGKPTQGVDWRSVRWQVPKD
jgi:outer membrane biosynthesis protein TonB